MPEALQTAIDAAREADDLPRLLTLLEEAAFDAMERLGVEQARPFLREGAAVAQETGDTIRAARCRYGLAILTEAQSPSSDRANAELRGAYAGLVSAGDAQGAASARKFLMLQYLERHDFDTAAQLAQENYTAADTLNLADLRLASLSGLAAAQIGQNKRREAVATLIKGIATAEFQGDDVANHELRTVRLVYGERRAQKPIQRELQTREAQNPQDAGALNVLMARFLMTEEDLEGALEHASIARRKALNTVDAVLYLLACVTLARVYEASDKHSDALSMVLTAYRSIRDLLGEDAAGPVLLLMESAKQRWGEEVFQAALENHRARMRKK